MHAFIKSKGKNRLSKHKKIKAFSRNSGIIENIARRYRWICLLKKFNKIEPFSDIFWLLQKKGQFFFFFFFFCRKITSGLVSFTTLFQIAVIGWRFQERFFKLLPKSRSRDMFSEKQCLDLFLFLLGFRQLV